MKNLTKKLLLAGLLSTSLLNAEIAFDLHAQHFSKAIEGKYEGARYELPKAFVSTNLKYIDGYYTTQNDNGYFNVEVKEPKVDWSVTIDANYYLSDGTTRTIKLVSDNGESIVVSLSYQDIHFNSTNVLTSLYNSERIATELVRNGDNIELHINGAKVGTAVRANFDKLKYVEVALISTNIDEDLHSLTIGSK